MLLYPDKLAAKLNLKFCSKLLVYGGEVQQTKDCIEIYNLNCKKHAINNRILLDAKDGIDWQLVLANSNNLDMFTQNKLLELNLNNFKQFTKVFNDDLYNFIINLNPSYALLIICDHLSTAIKQTSWFRLLQTDYLVVYSGNANKKQIKNYFTTNLQAAGFSIETNALEFLANCCTNNIYLANQIIQKLIILSPAKLITHADLQDIDEAAIFSTYDLIDLINSSNLNEALRCFNSLKEQQVEPILLLYALIQTTKTLLALRNNLHNNETNHIPIFKRYNIWDNKQALLLNKAKQLSTHALKRILVQCKIADAIIKVESPGNIWVALQEIVLYLLDTTMMPYACTF